MVENDLKVFVLKSLSNDPAILYNLIKVFFEGNINGIQVGLQFDGGGADKFTYIIEILFKEHDAFSIRVYTTDFFYLDNSTYGGLISSLPKTIQDKVNRIITYLKITGFNLDEDFYK